MKKRRSKRTYMLRKEAPKPAKPQCIKRRESLSCIVSRRQKLIYHAAHRRGC